MPVLSLHAFTQVGVHNYRENNDQTVNQLSVEARPAYRDGSSFYCTNDESPEESSKDGAGATEDRGATEKDRSQSSQQVAWQPRLHKKKQRQPA